MSSHLNFFTLHDMEFFEYSSLDGISEQVDNELHEEVM